MTLMNNAEDYLSEHWGLLRSKPDKISDEIGIPSFKLEVSTSYGHLRMALGGEGELRLLIPVDMTDRVADNIKGEGLHIDTEVFVVDGKNTRFLDIVCHESTLESVFTELVSEIVRRIDEGLNSLIAVEETITEFRRLLRRGGKQVNLEKIIGLIGELLLLRQIQAFNRSGWKGWLGSQKQRHDFIAGDTAIEVKTTSRAQKPVVTINAIDQLEAPGNGELYLMHYVLEQNQLGALHLPELAKEVTDQASDPDEITKLLENEGYSSSLSELWGHKRFDLRNAVLYKVDDGFPRLTLNDLKDTSLPEGVSHVTYRVDLSSARKFCVDEKEQQRVVKEFSECL